MKCIFCGADAESNGAGGFSCPYCGGTFEGEKKETVKEHALSDRADDANRLVVVKPKSNAGATVFEDNVGGVLEITWNPTKFTVTSGSGLLVDESGYALTNAHVVTDDKGRPVNEVDVKIAGVSVKATVIRLGDDKGGSGRGVDLALIKLKTVPSGARVVTFADFDKVRIGEQVFVIGNSLGDGTCITAGIVSDKQRTVNGHTLLMTDCAINGGNSGGPIFNSDGHVIGVICSSRIKSDGSATEGMNYAVPVNIASDFLSGKHTAVKVNPGEAYVDYKVASNPQGPRCPKCGSSDTDVENGIRYCMTCDYEW